MEPLVIGHAVGLDGYAVLLLELLAQPVRTPPVSACKDGESGQWLGWCGH